MPPYLTAYDDADATPVAGEAAPAPLPPPPKQNQTLLSLLLKPLIMALITTLFFLFLGFAALVLLCLCLAGGLLQRRRATHHQLPPPRSPGADALSPRDLKRLPRFKHAAPPREQGAVCAVCLDDFRRGQWCRALAGCGHVFHRGCVDTWLVKVAACPVCRAQVRADPDPSGSWANDQGGAKHQYLPFSLSC